MEKALFRLYFNAAIFRLIYQLQRSAEPDTGLQGVLARFPFLNDYLDLLRREMPEGVTWGEGLAWWQERIEEEPATALATLAPSYASQTALFLAGLPEADPRFGAVFAYLIGSGDPSRRVTPSLIWLLMGTGEQDPWSLCRILLENHLVVAADTSLPRAEWELSVPVPVWDLLRGEAPQEPWFRIRPASGLMEAADLLLPPEVRTTVARLPDVIRSDGIRYLVIRGMRGSERPEVAGAIARGLGLGTLEIDAVQMQDSGRQNLIGPMAALAGLMPVLSYEAGPGESIRPPDLAGYIGPAAILLGAEGGLAEQAGGAALTVSLPFPTPELRRRYWEMALDRRPCPDLDEVSRRILLPGGHIRRVASMAASQAALQQREAVTLADVREAARSLNRQQLDTLATRLEAGGAWSDLVVSEGVGLKLKELERRCRFRERVLEHLGARYTAGANRGVRALLSGPSGTGKTLSTRILAAMLETDLYRVDLASVVNKYIGETEKNLNQVFSRAEELDVILLLDEGDSLLAKRSDVKSSNDRYANLETNYLLQRLESYNGVVLITTNASQLIDQAFQRRMDVVVDFLPPGPADRLRLWKLHLPADHAVTESQLQGVALRCAMTGGQIRNAALQATLASLDLGRPLGLREVVEGIAAEYRKTGAMVPSLELEAAAPSSSPVDGLLPALPEAP